MIEYVWNGRIVSDAAITSAINQARQAVGDDGKKQAVIKTFPKRGFRFVAKLSSGYSSAAIPMPYEPESPSQDAGRVTIAVLPFDNLSDDAAQEFFADGVVEAIITDLSKLSGISMIARNSSFAYKGKAIDIRLIAKELNVTHVLEGSVQRSVDRVRISAQLIDAHSNSQLWAEQHDGVLNDVFALQDEISRRIISSLEINLYGVESSRLASSRVPLKEAFDYYVRGKFAAHPPTGENLREAATYFRKAIDLDPNFAGGYAGLGLVSAFEGLFGRISETGLDDAETHGKDFAAKAVAMDPHFEWAYVPLGFKKLVDSDLEGAVQTVSVGLAENPGDADLNAYMGYMLIWQGHGTNACRFIEAARRLDPHHQTYRLYNAYALFGLGEYESVVDLIENHVSVNRYSPMTFMFLVAANVRAGNTEGAATSVQLALARYQTAGMKGAQRFLPYAEPADRQAFLNDVSAYFR